MNRNQLALFHAVAKAGGISRGAIAAHVSQPAVSKQIAELESTLGVRLLDRQPRGCRLTEAGRILFDYAERWRALEGEAERAIDEYRGLKRGRLAVGASLTIGAYLLPPVIAGFHRNFPPVDISLEIANTEQIERALLAGRIDVGMTEGPIDSEELDSTVFFQDVLVPIAPAGHRLAAQAVVTLREVAREPFLMREAGSGTRAVVERALARHGVEVTPFMALASPEAIKNSVTAGLGIAVVSRLIVEAELAQGSLVILPVAELTIPRPLRLRRLRGRGDSPVLAEFLKELAAHGRAPAAAG